MILKRILQMYFRDQYKRLTSFYHQYLSQPSLAMASNQTNQNIQEMEQGQKNFGIVNTVKSIHKKVVSNELVSQFDVFSVPVKLTINGQETYKTCFGGFMYLLLVAACVLLTIFVLFPHGIQLESQISMVAVPQDSGDTGQTLFDHTDQIIGFKGVSVNTTSIIGYVNISDKVTLRAYQMDSNNNTVPLEISTNCNDDYQFCIKNTESNKNAKIFGNYYQPNTFSKYLMIEAIWCNTSNPICLPANKYALETSYSNFYKKKGGELLEYKTKKMYSFTKIQITTNVTRQQFKTNSKFFGHLSNIFASTIQIYFFQQLNSQQNLQYSKLLTPGDFSLRSYLRIKITPFGSTRLINQKFDDVTDIILFFLSVKQTFYILIFIIFIKQYNRNAGLLDVGSSLFYIDDPKTKKKYDFTSGYYVFIACLFHNHPVTNLIQFLLTKMGRTLEDFFPSKTLCAIKLMKKAEEMLQENSFYGNLNQLSSMQTQASRKIPLADEGQKKYQDEQSEMSYFPLVPTDSQAQKKDKQIKREAFNQFCEAHQHLSPQRKNFIYKILTNNKLKHILVHEIQRQFKSFVKNVRIQKCDDIYQEVEEEQFSEIKVGVNESSIHQMSGHNFIRT